MNAKEQNSYLSYRQALISQHLEPMIAKHWVEAQEKQAQQAEDTKQAMSGHVERMRKEGWVGIA